MTLTQTVVSALIAALIGLLTARRGGGAGASLPGFRRWLLLLLSILAVFWLQPSLPIRYLDFWLPVATLALTVVVWALTAPPEVRVSRNNLGAAITLIGAVLGLGATRLLIEPLITASRPPPAPQILAALVLVSLFL